MLKKYKINLELLLLSRRFFINRIFLFVFGGKEFMEKKILAIFVAIVFLGSSFFGATATKVDNNKLTKEIENNEIEKILSIDSDALSKGQSELKTLEIKDINNLEKIEIEFNEDVNILEDGTLHLFITMDILSKKLVDLYKDSFGIPEDATDIDSEIPEETTRIVTMESEDGTIKENEVVQAVREPFFEGVAEEQKFLYGFIVTECFNSRLFSEDLENSLQISVEAKAFPYVTDSTEEGEEKQIAISSSPSDVVSYFISSQMELANVMLRSFDGDQMYKKSVNMNINLPEDASFINVDTDQRRLSLGTAGYQANIVEASNSKIEMTENWLVVECQSVPQDRIVDELFNFEYSIITDTKTKTSGLLGEGYDTSALNDDPWEWSMNWDIVHLEDPNGNPSYSIDVDLYLTLTGTLHCDLGAQCIWARFDVLAGLEVDVQIDGAWSHTFPILGYSTFSGDKYGWRGLQTYAVVVTVTPTAEVTVDVGGSLHVNINPEANFWIKAGGDLDIVWDWNPFRYKTIFDYGYGGTFDYTYELSAYAKIRPSIGFAISLTVFGIIGPRITPTLFLEGEIGYDSSQGAYWKAVLGFDLIVGIQFTALYWDWPHPVYSCEIYRWEGSWAPTDSTPPETTAYMGPWRNGYWGPLGILWFEAVDPGANGNSISETKFRIPQASDPSWRTFNNDMTYIVVTGIPDYTVQWYSKDSAGNQESTKTGAIQADIYKPVGSIAFDGPNEENGDNEWTIEQDDTTVMLRGEDESTRSTDARCWLQGEHVDSGTVTEWSITSYHSGLYGFDVTFADPGDWIITFVVEDGVWNVRVYTLTFHVTGDAPPDTTPPTPNPSTWATNPHATGQTSIAMKATTATDPSGGVQYYFEETTGHSGGSNSGWQSSSSYTDSGLSPGTTYKYRVRTRDALGNTGSWSTTKSATTENEPTEADVDLTEPERGAFYIGGIKFASGYPFPFALLFLCSGVSCKAYVEGTGIDVVVFSCGSRSVEVDFTGDGYYTARITGVMGSATVYAEAQDSGGNTLDSDSVRILKFGGS